MSIPPINKRINAVREKRLSGTGTEDLAEKPHQFREMHMAKIHSIIVPTVSSERRNYIPIDYIKSKDVIIAPNQVIYDPSQKTFGVISSSMHMAWMRMVAGRMKTDYRYSSTIVYNTFPFPPITPAQEQELTETALGILAAREQHPGATLAELYDPDKMPENLREAHRANDLAVERCYRAEPFGSDEERLAYLFKLYEEMIAAEAARDTLFAATKKKGERKKKG